MGIHEKIQRLESIRLRATRGICYIGIGVTVFFFTMGFFRSTLGMIIGIALGVFGGILLRGTHADFKRLYKDLFAEDPLEKNFDDVFYSPRGGFDLETVNGFQLCKKGDRIKSEDYVKALYREISFEMSDVILEETKNGNKTGMQEFFRGRILTFDFTGKHVNPIRVYSKYFNRSKEAATKQNKIDMESVSFNYKFDVYAEASHDAFYLLTPPFMKQLENLQKKYPEIGICISGEKAIVALYETKDAFDSRNWLGEISYPDEIRAVQQDIDDIKVIIEMVNRMEHD